MNELTNKNILQYAVENDMIDLSYVQEQMAMKKRLELLTMHPYKISQGKDSRWRTYLPNENTGRKMVKRNTRKEVEDVVVEFYKSNEEKPKTFDDAYQHWRTIQDTLVSSNSTVKYDIDYKRYFENTDFSRKLIEKITEEDIKVFIVKTVKDKKLCKKACKTLFGYIRNTINSARINKIIYDNPMEFLEAKQFYKYCTDVSRANKKKLVSDSEMKLLYMKFFEDYESHPEYIPTYAVHLATLTGMRVGEISALSWECVMENYIIIDKSEKYNRKTKEYHIDKTKNGKSRAFPLTDEIKDLLDAVKKAEMQNGYICEWVFANEAGRIHAPVISSCLKNKCRQIGISEKGIHAFRRTINSKLRCRGVSSTIAASLLGHTEEVNEMYYTFDVSSMQEKAMIVSGVNKNII